MTQPPVIALVPKTRWSGRHHRHRRSRIRCTARLAAAILLPLVALLGLAPMAVAAGPAPAQGVALREPFGDYVTRLSFDVSSVDPALVTAGGPAALTITGTMTNTGPETLTNLAYRFQRGQALGGTADVRQELASPSEPTAQVPEKFTEVAPELAAGASTPFVFTVPITGDDGLAVDAKGVYPLMVNVNGAVGLPDGPLEARVGELHLLLTVMGVPGSGAADGSGTPTAAPGGHPLPVNFVWPLVDQPHLGVGGVFLDDDLLTSISPGGRLATLVDGLLDPSAEQLPAGAVTAVMDPQLLDELNRMTSAYRVVATPGDPQPQMTQILQAETSAADTPTTAGTAAGGAQGSGLTSALSAPTAAAPTTAVPTTAVPTTAAPTTDAIPADPGNVDIPGTVAGTGQVAATSFLERLRMVAARYPVLVLPYGDPDVVALVRAGLNGEVAAAVDQGQEVAERVLAPSTTDLNPNLGTSMGFPIDGAADGNTLAVLRDAGLRTALLSENSVQLDQPKVAAAQVAVPSSDGADSSGNPLLSAIAQSDVLTGVDVLIDQGKASGWAMRVNALTGVLAQQTFDSAATAAAVTPAVFIPDRRWSPDAPGLRVLTDLLSTLGASQVISGISLTDLPQSAISGATPAYPEQAEARELSPEYLDRIKTNRAEVASLRQSLASVSQSTDPDLVLDPLDTALDAAASTAFRIDPAVGEANLTTVEAATAGIRSGVEILSAGNSYTLASSSSPLVLTVQNNTAYDVPVKVEITGGDRVGLTVTDPPVQVVPAGRSQQVKIPAEVSRSGQFQVSAQLVGEDGQPWGPPVQLAVESTAYGALTVIIILVAGGVLVLMVVLRIIQRLRGKGDGPAVGLTPKEPITQPRNTTRTSSDGEPNGKPSAGQENGHAAIRQTVGTPTGSSNDERAAVQSGGPTDNGSTLPRTEQVRTDRP